ncbi:MAG: hypothetical protein HY738_14005 [Bacteroidia bacterium]|nr:hypothetical protein [Bacteroidia bacterium]
MYRLLLQISTIIKIKHYNIFIIFYIISFTDYPQVTYEHLSTTGIYDFLDELANDKVICLNDAIKPFSRKYIAEKLLEAGDSQETLTKRQNKELKFYLDIYTFENKPDSNIYTGKKTDLTKKKPVVSLSNHTNLALSFYPPGLFYAENGKNITIKPIYGITYSFNERGDMRHTWGGFAVVANLGKHIGIYGSVRDNYSTQILAFPAYFSMEPGGTYKLNEGGRKGGDWSEARGGITYGWKWGSCGIIKDHIAWGTNYHGANIFSGRTPSFPLIKVDIDPFNWFEFDYYHGWLISEVIDSARSYYTPIGTYRAVYRNKFIAANMLTVRPWKTLNISMGNSIIYSDVNAQPGYLIPFLFFKSVDHTINYGIENQNAQMFLNASSRLIKHVHVFFTLFIDELSLKRITDPNENNFISFKCGLKFTDLLIHNLSVTGEYTRSSPIVFKHKVPATTFTSNNFNLGHFMVDNSEDYYACLEYKPLPRCSIKGEFIYSVHGNDYQYMNSDVTIYPFIAAKTWEQKIAQLSISWLFLECSQIFLTYRYSDIKGYETDGFSSLYYLNLFTPDFYQGKKNTISIGINYCF